MGGARLSCPVLNIKISSLYSLKPEIKTPSILLGYQGSQGFPGDCGFLGPRGVRGEDGAPGQNGRAGINGPQVRGWLWGVMVWGCKCVGVKVWVDKKIILHG